MVWYEKRRQSFEDIWDRANRARKGRKVKISRGSGVRMSELRRGESVKVRYVPYTNRGHGVVLVGMDDDGMEWEVSQLGLTKLDIEEGNTIYNRRENQPVIGSHEEIEERERFKKSYREIDLRQSEEAREAMRESGFRGWN